MPERAALSSEPLSVFPVASPRQIPVQLLYFVTDCDYKVFNIHANGRGKPAITAGRSPPSEHNNPPVHSLPLQTLGLGGSAHKSFTCSRNPDTGETIASRSSPPLCPQPAEKIPALPGVPDLAPVNLSEVLWRLSPRRRHNRAFTTAPAAW